jgi:radical SAM protein with 4Fe4S-binding SPASM domain
VKKIIDNIKLRPKYCVWELTSRCNFHCLHCASNLYEDYSRGRELNQVEALGLCEDLSDLGCGKIILSGGEALLRPDWEVIARRIVELGMHASLISNGFIIDKKHAEKIAATGICRVGISLDGMEKTHNHIRCNQRAFERACKACANLTELNIPVNVITHINKLNFTEIHEMEDLFVSLNIDIWRLQLGAPLGRLDKHPELIIEPFDLPAVAEAILDLKRNNRLRISVGDNIGYYTPYEPALRHSDNKEGLNFWCGCSAGCLNIGIEANGNVKGCLSLQSDRFIEGNIRQEPIKTIWKKPGNFSYTREFRLDDLDGYCKNCELGEICRGGCTFMSVGATGKAHNNPYCLFRVLKTVAQP